MSVLTEINRIKTAVANIVTAIKGKGVSVPSTAKIGDLATYIGKITTPILQSKTVSPSTSSQTVKPDSSYNGLSQVTVNAIPTDYVKPSGTKTISSSGTHDVKAYASASVAAGSVSNPSITVDSTGKITASSTKTAGYITSGTASNTKQLTTQAAKTVTPTTSNQTAVASGVYTTGAVTVKGDTYLKAENIKENVTIFGIKGTYKGGASVGTCTVILDVSTMDWYANNNVRVFYTSYSSGFNTNVIQTNASTTGRITLSNVVCGSAISVWTQVYAYISPSTYTKYTDEYNHCFICPNSPGQTITIELLENS